MREDKIKDRVMLALSKFGARIFTNPVGNAWLGGFVKRDEKGITHLAGARRVEFGLIKGSSDLIGWYSMIIEKEMVGRKVAVFCAIETKQPGKKPTPEQANFIVQVKEAGGIAEVVTDQAQVVSIIQNFRVMKKKGE